ncbi:hypothetical protein GLAREA_04031 [Glarea lozoyensis ATCC 20868]|uniref:Uncharacterized protein n=1 Tax=Glarea lozoyensis (strain ATCC 20868 / MF5171) TaxID=1116229 RepID=S3D1M1_GLAL2|nr:uncharacterized protein GLAREA_04031 [Glarea lozoyensis ATCC 20868]EPE31064.1 hypothetical protein GLAREA_04031 [Glarea lozoyensis ATCC 20868]
MPCMQRKFNGSYLITIPVTVARPGGSQHSRNVEIWTSNPRDHEAEKRLAQRIALDGLPAVSHLPTASQPTVTTAATSNTDKEKNHWSAERARHDLSRYEQARDRTNDGRNWDRDRGRLTQGQSSVGDAVAPVNPSSRDTEERGSKPQLQSSANKNQRSDVPLPDHLPPREPASMRPTNLPADKPAVATISLERESRATSHSSQHSSLRKSSRARASSRSASREEEKHEKRKQRGEATTSDENPRLKRKGNEETEDRRLRGENSRLRSQVKELSSELDEALERIERRDKAIHRLKLDVAALQHTLGKKPDTVKGSDEGRTVPPSKDKCSAPIGASDDSKEKNVESRDPLQQHSMDTPGDVGIAVTKDQSNAFQQSNRRELYLLKTLVITLQTQKLKMNDNIALLKQRLELIRGAVNLDFDDSLYEKLMVKLDDQEQITYEKLRSL